MNNGISTTNLDSKIARSRGITKIYKFMSKSIIYAIFGEENYPCIYLYECAKAKAASRFMYITVAIPISDHGHAIHTHIHEHFSHPGI